MALSRLTCCLLVLYLAAAAKAASGDWIILGGGNSFWTSNPDLAVCKELSSLQSQHTFKCVAFTPAGDWVILMEGNSFYSNNLNLPACKKMMELQKQNADFKWVAFAPNGGWTLFWGGNGSWNQGIPAGAMGKIGDVTHEGGEFRSISFGPNGSWTLSFDKTGVWCDGISDKLGATYGSVMKKGLSIRCVAFDNAGNWWCLTNHGFWTSSVDLVVSKQLSLISKAKSPTCVAFVPSDDPSAGPCWLESTPSQRVTAVLTTDIGHPDATVDDWYLYAPDVPNLPGQQDVKVRFTPPGKIVDDFSPLKRPVILTRITDGRKSVHAILTIQATLMSRHLRPLAPGQDGPPIDDLSPQEVKNYTSSSTWLDFNAKSFRGWMNAVHLKRTSDESDIAYARRAFAYVKHHFTYEWPTDSDTASKTCAAGKSDCGGLSDVFTSLMRANGIPARLLGGRWAASQDQTGTQTHAKAEFFAHGIGWVPVDTSSAVSDTAGDDFVFFGQDNGDFISFADDQNLILDSFVSGRQNIPIFQGLAYWWQGSGADQGNSFKDSWTVTPLH